MSREASVEHNTSSTLQYFLTFPAPLGRLQQHLSLSLHLLTAWDTHLFTYFSATL